jgi:hypothetical protein
MKYSSEQEKQFVDDAIKSNTYRIDSACKTIFKLNAAGNAYVFENTFWALKVHCKNTDRFIIRAIYRNENSLNILSEGRRTIYNWSN